MSTEAPTKAAPNYGVSQEHIEHMNRVIDNMEFPDVSMYLRPVEVRQRLLSEIIEYGEKHFGSISDDVTRQVVADREAADAEAGIIR